MDTIEIAVFVGLVVGSVLLIVGIVWFIQWRRDPAAFRAWLKRDPMHRGGRVKR